MNKLYILPVLLLCSFLSFGQTKGLIYKPASTAEGRAVLDPNGDGYTSQTSAGFKTNDRGESEIRYVPAPVLVTEPVQDPLRGPGCGFTDLVDSGEGDPFMFYYDGANFLVRFRLNKTSPNSKGYSVLIDTDQKFGFSGASPDPNAVVGNPGFELELVLMTNHSVSLYDVDGTTAPVLKASKAYESHGQKSVAFTEECGDQDYFYDFYMPWAEFGLSADTKIRMAALSVMNPEPSIGNNAKSDVGGVDDGTYAGNYDKAFEDLINNYYPTSPQDGNAGVKPRSLCPTISAPILVTSSSISGTSTEAVGAIITVFKNNTALSATATVTAGGTWSLPVSGLAEGDVITASAKAPGKEESERNCSGVLVTQNCSKPTMPGLSASNGNSNKYVTINVPVAGTVTLYLGSEVLVSKAVAAGTYYYCPTAGSNLLSTSNSCNGGNNLAAGVYRATITVGGCTSNSAFLCVNTTSTSAAPTVNSPITTVSSFITGKATPNAQIILKVNGAEVAQVITDASGNWSAPAASLNLKAGDEVTAFALEAGKCQSVDSTPVTVIMLRSLAPVITGTYCGATSNVTGASSEAAGTTITLYVNGAVAGTTTTNANGSWAIATGSLAAGTKLTATATAPGKSESPLSAEVLVKNVSSSASITISASIDPATSEKYILENATVISGTGPGEAGIVRLYVDGAFIGSATLVGGAWSVEQKDFQNDFFLYAGANLTATFTAEGACESDPTPAVIIRCVPPAEKEIAPTSLTLCSGETPEVTVKASEALVIYTLYNGTVAISSQLGTGGDLVLKAISPLTTTTVTTVNLTVVARKMSYVESVTCEQTLSEVAVTLNPKIENNTVALPGGVTEFCGATNVGTITGSSPSGGNGEYTYQWQISADNTTWADITGDTDATKKDYNPGLVSTTTYFRRKAFSGGCTDAAAPASIMVKINDTDVENSITYNGTSSFCDSGDPSELAGNEDASFVSYQWQRSLDGTNFENIEGATTAKYDPAALTQPTTFRRVTNNGTCDSYSNEIKIEVYPAVANNKLIAPATITFCGPASVGEIEGSMPTEGDNSYTFKWQQSTDNGVSFTDISPAVTTQHYTPGTVATTTYFRRLVTSGPCVDVASDVVKITVISLAKTTISTDENSLVADGSSSTTVRVQLKDDFETNVVMDACELNLTTDKGTITGIAYAGDGAYTATLTAGTAAGLATITGTVNGAAITDDAEVTFVPALNLATTTVTANPSMLYADGTSTSLATVAFKDYAGNPITVDASKVVLELDGVPVTTENKGNGVFTAIVPAQTAPTTVVVTAKHDGVKVNDEAMVLFETVPVVLPTLSLANSTVTVSPAQVNADGVSTATAAVQFRSTLGENMTVEEEKVQLLLDNTAVAFTNKGNGLFEAVVPARVAAAVVEVSAKYEGALLSSTASVEFVPVVNLAATEVTASPEVVNADGSATATARVAFKDHAGNPIAVDAADVELLLDNVAVTAQEAAAGVFTATVPARTAAATVTITATYKGATLSDNATVEFVPTLNFAGTVVTASPEQVSADGVSTSTATVSFRDYAGNAIAVDAAELEILLDGVAVAFTPGSAGVYTATVPARTAAGTVTVTVSYNNTLAADKAEVEFVPVANLAGTVVTASPEVVNADGVSTSTARVEFKDYAGNAIAVEASKVEILLDGETAQVTEVSAGAYTATVPARTKAGTVVVTASYDNNTVTDEAAVTFVSALNLAATEVTAFPATVNADGVSTSLAQVAFKDHAGNGISVDAAKVRLLVDGVALADLQDKGNGVFTATVPARTVAGKAEVTANYNTTPVADKAEVEFIPALNLLATTVVASPEQVNADGVSTATATITFRDYANEAIEVNAAKVEILLNGTAVVFTPGTTGVYTATVPARTAAGTVTVTVAYDNVLVADNATVEFISTVNLAATEVTVSPERVSADGVATATARVVFKDYAGNSIATDASNVALLLDGIAVEATAKGDGVFEATVPARTVAATVEVTARYEGEPVGAQPTVEFVPVVNLAGTVVTASPEVVSADGVSTSTARVAFKDYAGNPIAVDAAKVEILLDGEAVQVTEVSAGVYTAVVEGRTSAAVVEVAARYEGTALTDKAEVEFVPVVNLAATEVSASPTIVNADGVSTSTATVTFRDYAGKGISVEASKVELLLDGVGVNLTPSGTGVFEAVVPARVAAAVVEVSAKYEGALLSSTASVEFVPVVNLAATEVTASPEVVNADGSATATARVAFKDYAGNPIAVDAADVELLLDNVAVTAQEAAAGVFTATVPARTAAATVTITATYKGATLSDNATVEFVPTLNFAGTVVTASPEQVSADGVSTSTATVSFRDYAGNAIAVDAAELEILLDGVAVAFTPGSAGVYTATVPARTAAGTVTVTVSYNNTLAADKAEVEFVPVLDLRLATVTANPTTVVADGVSVSVITVQLKDADGNNFATNLPVSITSSFGALSAVTNNGNGNYSATLSSAAIGKATIVAQVGTEQLSPKPEVTFVAGSASEANTTIIASKSSIPADGVSTSIITVTLFDAQGHRIRTGGHTVTLATTLGTLGAITDHNNGTYTAVLSSGVTSGTAVVSGTVNGVAINSTASVNFTTLPVANEAPIAVNDTYTVNNHEKLTGNVLLNDSDPDGDPLAVKLALVRQPIFGSVIMKADGSFTYTPNKGYRGEDSFVYEVCDNGDPAKCAQATVTIQVKQGQLFIPEGFSPDWDGVNDVFVLYGAEEYKVSLKVFNRWGDIVYENDHYQNDWDGTANKGLVIGDKLPEGTYFYVIDLNNGEKPRRHSLIIRRK
ncbi:gliding motility-associated-like protein [Pontibacter ummariensis]|uniref:Gliding motility-associated C-terminal domain-containing protein n=1 Tax=Pontibacter ummariensis TaxID=1610492 RepID=A0A239BEP2_9BACT|nr:invasin domain 3-containing protein [Pontibacter ummariensis]PRY16508.1 gliding motility-associated-like protein [Pontibacter ummariensis]SNS06420.1 gliding motility-associated C-terminal domain-containing protein [Pontibacter ummariensis]